jgi:hypothetical protein
VALKVVVAAAAANKASGGFGLAPAITITPVPDAVLRTERPLSAFRVDNAELADRGPEGTGVHGATAPLAEERLVARLGLAEGIDRHRASI